MQLQQGGFAFRQRGGLVATVWKDKRVVTTLSNMTQADAATTVERKLRDGTVKTIFYSSEHLQQIHEWGGQGRPAQKLLPS